MEHCHVVENDKVKAHQYQIDVYDSAKDHRQQYQRNAEVWQSRGDPVFAPAAYEKGDVVCQFQKECNLFVGNAQPDDVLERQSKDDVDNVQRHGFPPRVLQAHFVLARDAIHQREDDEHVRVKEHRDGDLVGQGVVVDVVSVFGVRVLPEPNERHLH